MAKPNNVKLYYFNLAGRGEATRLALHAGGIKFEDMRLTGEDFGKQKAAGKWKYGQVPILEVDGQQLAQSLAMLRWAGKLTNTYPADPWEAAIVDEAVYLLQDIGNLILPSFSEQDVHKKIEMRKKLLAEDFPKWFGYIAQNLAKHPYVAGNSVTIADFQLYGLLSWFTSGALDGIPPDFIKSYPEIDSHFKRIRQLPSLEAYFSEREAAAKQHK